jgi:hypothetical protein
MFGYCIMRLLSFYTFKCLFQVQRLFETSYTPKSLGDHATAIVLVLECRLCCISLDHQLDWCCRSSKALMGVASDNYRHLYVHTLESKAGVQSHHLLDSRKQVAETEAKRAKSTYEVSAHHG